jgi:two-component system, chemotaxis family, protein-glutamate methylesterase/glutaminase
MNILVVDDDITNISIIRVTLSKIGHTVFTARDGLEAMAILQSESIGALLTDWMMPNLDGMGLLRWVRVSLQPIPILIMTTALGSHEAQTQAREAGADAYLIKPIIPAHIVEVLEELHQKKISQADLTSIQATTSVPSSVPDFFGIGLVAGTGGAVGVRTILSNIGPLKNAAWFIVLHGPGWAAEALAEQMRTYTASNVVIPRGGESVEPTTIYIAPGDKHMVVVSKNPVIQLTSAPPENFLRPSADPLFIGIAQVFGRRAVGVVLGGSGSDGSIGCGHIKVAQGAVIVEEPTNAVSSQMPQHVISLGLASLIVPLERIAASVAAELHKDGRTLPGRSMPETIGAAR